MVNKCTVMHSALNLRAEEVGVARENVAQWVWPGESPYALLSFDAMRAAVCSKRIDMVGVSKATRRAWRDELSAQFAARTNLHQLCSGGVTVELLAFCKFTIDDLVLPRNNIPPHVDHRSHYYLEHVLDALQPTVADLALLGLTVAHFADFNHYPLVLLIDRLAFDASSLFALCPTRLQLSTMAPIDAKILRLNMPFWDTVVVDA